jgi:hypothetical protein
VSTLVAGASPQAPKSLKLIIVAKEAAQAIACAAFEKILQ